MDTPNSSPVISPVTYLIAGGALLLAGGIIGVFADPYLPSSLSNAKKGYQSGFMAARTLVEKSSLGAFFTATPSDIRTISGKVTAVQGNRITIHSDSVNNPFDGPAINDRTIIIDANTKVMQLTGKDAATIQAEIAAFIKAKKTTQATTTLGYIKTTVNASSIQVGGSLVVTAGENVKTLSEFTATEIQIQPKMFTK